MPDDGDIGEFKKGTQSARDKLNKMKDKVNAHEKALKKLSKYGPYMLVVCVDDTPQVLEILARKQDAGDVT